MGRATAAPPHRLDPLAAFKGFWLYRVRRLPAPWEAAGLTVRADCNRIEVENPRGARGRFVLSYHWFAGFRATPEIAIRAEFQGDDPVPFIALDDPPPRVTLRWSPWNLLGPR